MCTAYVFPPCRGTPRTCHSTAVVPGNDHNSWVHQYITVYVVFDRLTASSNRFNPFEAISDTQINVNPDHIGISQDTTTYAPETHGETT